MTFSCNPALKHLSWPTLALVNLLSPVFVFATENNEQTFLLNYDIIIESLDNSGGVRRIHQIGIPFSPRRQLHGTGLGKTDYFFSISSLEGSQGKLTVEVYKFETRAKDTDPTSEYVSEIDFTLGAPTRLQATNDEFSIDLAFSISQRAEPVTGRLEDP
jgi:hypothetical protein